MSRTRRLLTSSTLLAWAAALALTVPSAVAAASYDGTWTLLLRSHRPNHYSTLSNPGDTGDCETSIKVSVTGANFSFQGPHCDLSIVGVGSINSSGDFSGRISASHTSASVALAGQCSSGGSCSASGKSNEIAWSVELKDRESASGSTTGGCLQPGLLGEKPDGFVYWNFRNNCDQDRMLDACVANLPYPLNIAGYVYTRRSILVPAKQTADLNVGFHTLTVPKTTWEDHGPTGGAIACPGPDNSDDDAPDKNGRCPEGKRPVNGHCLSIGPLKSCPPQYSWIPPGSQIPLSQTGAMPPDVRECLLNHDCMIGTNPTIRDDTKCIKSRDAIEPPPSPCPANRIRPNGHCLAYLVSVPYSCLAQKINGAIECLSVNSRFVDYQTVGGCPAGVDEYCLDLLLDSPQPGTLTSTWVDGKIVINAGDSSCVIFKASQHTGSRGGSITMGNASDTKMCRTTPLANIPVAISKYAQENVTLEGPATAVTDKEGNAIFTYRYRGSNTYRATFTATYQGKTASVDNEIAGGNLSAAIEFTSPDRVELPCASAPVITLDASPARITAPDGSAQVALTGYVIQGADCAFSSVLLTDDSTYDVGVGKDVKVNPNGAFSMVVPITRTRGPRDQTLDFSIAASNQFGQADKTVSVILPAAPAPKLAEVSLDPDEALGGKSVTGKVSLAEQAAISTVMPLTSDNLNASVPKTVTVPAGKDNATFTVKTKPVSMLEKAKISVSLANAEKTATLRLLPLTGLKPVEVSLDPEEILGGRPIKGKVTLSDETGADAVVTLASDNLNAVVARTVTVLAGKDNAAFNIDTKVVSNPQKAGISAKLGDFTKTATLSLLGELSRFAEISLDPDEVQGGKSAKGTVTLGDKTSGDAIVTLASDNAAAVVARSVTVPAGKDSASFTVETKAVGNIEKARISATFGNASKTATLTIEPAAGLAKLDSVEVDPEEVMNGVCNDPSGLNTVVKVTVRLSDKAVADTVVAVASDKDPVSCGSPGNRQMLVLAGQDHADYMSGCGGCHTLKAQKVTFTATLGNVSKRATVTIKTPESAKLDSVEVDADEIVGNNGGKPVKVTAILTERAAVDTDVQVEIFNQWATGKNKLTVRAGQDRASFFNEFDPTQGLQPVIWTIAATLGTTVKTAKLTAKPAASAKLESVEVNPKEVMNGVCNDPSGLNTVVKVTVRLSDKAVADTVVAVASDKDPVSCGSPGNRQMLVLAGQDHADYMSGCGGCHTLKAQKVTFTATLGNISKTATVTIK